MRVESTITRFCVWFAMFAGLPAEAAPTSIRNGQVSLSCDPDTGRYSVTDLRRDQVVIRNSELAFNDRLLSEPGWLERSLAVETAEDKDFGAGERLILTARRDGFAEVSVAFTLYQDHPFFDVQASVRNLGGELMRFKSLHVLSGLCAVGEGSPAILVGGGGGDETRVIHKPDAISRNNLLVTYGPADAPRSIVAGGLTYADFEKFAQTQGDPAPETLKLQLYAKDPVGRGIRPGELYRCPDRFYLDVGTADPFVALERYAHALRAAQQVTLPPYTFPTVCMWFLNHSAYGGKTGLNSSAGAVAEMDRVVARRFLRYSPVAVRLVPDCYDYDNQQSWWDDEHWARHGGNLESPPVPHYQEPYGTTKKWAGAIRERGGIPLTYFQTNWRSEDYARQYPGHMLFNHSWARRNAGPDKRFSTTAPARHGNDWKPCEDRNRAFHGHDYTDPAFIEHMQKVYRNLKQGGVAGLMYDFAWSGWPDEGGMEDETSTSAAAYRKIFRLAQEGLGPECWIHERNLERGSDMALGCVASQRTEWDTDRMTPQSVTRIGLRWYKNRVVVAYDADAKNVNFEDADARRAIMTMSYVVSGRLLLGVSFGACSDAVLHDLSRIFPFHESPQSARPVDAFVRDIPNIYDFKAGSDWHQLTLYNDDSKQPKEVVVPLAPGNREGGLALDPAGEYCFYDFWNETFLGSKAGSEVLKQTLRPGEARMISIHRKTDHPQFLSTNRHVMQGYVELSQVRWKANVYSGVARVAADESLRIVIATNGHEVERVEAGPGTCRVLPHADPGLLVLELSSPKTEEIDWSIEWKKS